MNDENFENMLFLKEKVTISSKPIQTIHLLQNSLQMSYKLKLYKAHKNSPQRRKKSQHFAHANRNPSQKFRPHD